MSHVCTYAHMYIISHAQYVYIYISVCVLAWIFIPLQGEGNRGSWRNRSIRRLQATWHGNSQWLPFCTEHFVSQCLHDVVAISEAPAGFCVVLLGFDRKPMKIMYFDCRAVLLYNVSSFLTREVCLALQPTRLSPGKPSVTEWLASESGDLIRDTRNH